MRKTFHGKLDEITEDLLEMGSVIQNILNSAVDALINNDMELAQKVIDNDSKVDDYDIKIEEKCMIIQAEYQPVAVDLRLINSIYIIDIYLERIGDICVSIAKLAKRLYLKEKINIDKGILDLLIEMSSVVKTILDKALRAFRYRDVKLASKLEQMDDTIDSLQKAIYKKLYSSNSRDKNYIKIVTNVSLLSRYLERVGDNSVNIGDRVVYFLTGDFRAIHSDL